MFQPFKGHNLKSHIIQNVTMVTMSKYIKRIVKSLSLLKCNWVIKVKMLHRKHIYI